MLFTERNTKRNRNTAKDLLTLQTTSACDSNRGSIELSKFAAAKNMSKTLSRQVNSTYLKTLHGTKSSYAQTINAINQNLELMSLAVQESERNAKENFFINRVQLT